MKSVTWSSPYTGTYTGGTLSVDNVNHTLNFNLVFTLPENYSAQYLTTYRNWFTNFTLYVWGKNNYTTSTSAWNERHYFDDRHGQSQAAEYYPWQKAQAAAHLEVYFYNATWTVPTYNAAGNSYTSSIQTFLHEGEQPELLYQRNHDPDIAARCHTHTHANAYPRHADSYSNAYTYPHAHAYTTPTHA